MKFYSRANIITFGWAITVSVGGIFMLKFEFLKVVRMYEDARCLLLATVVVFLLAAVFAFAFKHTGIYAAAAFAMFGVCV